MLLDSQKTKVFSMIAQGAHIPLRDFSEYIPLRNYRMDSLDTLSLVRAIEEEFSISIADGEIEKLKTGIDVIACIERLI